MLYCRQLKCTRRRIYEVKRYHKTAIFDVNMHLVYRWLYVEKYLFTSKVKAMKAFTACNHYENEKAVLRVKKGGRR